MTVLPIGRPISRGRQRTCRLASASTNAVYASKVFEYGTRRLQNQRRGLAGGGIGLRAGWPDRDFGPGELRTYCMILAVGSCCVMAFSVTDTGGRYPKDE
jgi:hypothetical protein